MAGIIPSTGITGKPMRKQWFMHNEPRGSLRGLRSRLAEDGCAESQVSLAKKLLEEECDLEVDREENAKLGVYWLTKASEQGNLEATEILRECLATGHGITEHNYYDAKSCLEMSQNEKLARRAAKQLFSTLSNGEDFVTIDQLRRQMLMIKNDQQSLDVSDEDSPSSSEDSSSFSRENDAIEGRFSGIRSGDNRRKISEAALTSAASSYARGLIPTVSRALCMINIYQQMELDSLPILQRSFIHPILFIKWLYNWFINYVGRKGIKFLTKSLFSSNISTLFLLLLYSLFGTDSLLLFIPMIIYYLSFIMMIISTIQMFHSNCEFENFKNWSGLFIQYSGGNLNTDEAEYQYCKNNLKPYGQFFLSLLLNLMIYPIIAHQWTPQSEFTVISFLLTLTTLFNFSWYDKTKLPDLLQLFSFCLNVLAKYPYETDIVVGQTWRFLDIQVPTFASYVVGNGIEFCLNFRVFFYLLIPTVFVKMAIKDNWKGTYKLLIPHCVVLSWWQLTILSSQGATWYGLIRGTLALVGMLLFLPIAGLASILLPIVAIFKYLSSNDIIIKLIITLIIGGLPIILSWYFKKTHNSRYNWIINYLQIIFTLLAVVFLSWPFIIDFKNHHDLIDNSNYQTIKESSLTWEQYQSYCHQPAWEEIPSKALVQLDCHQLSGVLISWEGYITNVKIKNIQNPFNTFIDNLPQMFSNKLRCFFGQPIYENELCKYSDENRQKICLLMAKYKKNEEICHINDWNRFEFEIFVKMKSGMWGNNAEIVLIADNSFYNFSLHVFPGDKIRFSGILTNQNLEKEFLLGGTRPHVNVEHMECILCHTNDLKSSKKIKKSITINLIIRTIILGIKTVLNFVLNPLVIFK